MLEGIVTVARYIRLFESDHSTTQCSAFYATTKHNSAQERLPPTLEVQKASYYPWPHLPDFENLDRRLLTDEQRSQIRTRTMVLLEEEDATVDLFNVLPNKRSHHWGQIAECNTVILSKIARIDYPANWYVETALLLSCTSYITGRISYSTL